MYNLRRDKHMHNELFVANYIMWSWVCIDTHTLLLDMHMYVLHF